MHGDLTLGCYCPCKKLDVAPCSVTLKLLVLGTEKGDGWGLLAIQPSYKTVTHRIKADINREDTQHLQLP